MTQSLREVVDRECVGRFLRALARVSGIYFQACSFNPSDISSSNSRSRVRAAHLIKASFSPPFADPTVSETRFCVRTVSDAPLDPGQTGRLSEALRDTSMLREVVDQSGPVRVRRMHDQLERLAVTESNGGEVAHVARREPTHTERLGQSHDRRVD